jgi:hypothetical protein
MPNPLTMNVNLSSQGVEQIEVLYPPGQRQAAWLLCRQLLPHLEGLDRGLAETVHITNAAHPALIHSKGTNPHER